MPQLLDPPTTEAALRERAEELAHDVEGRLEPASADSEDAEARVAARQTFFDELRTVILSIAQSPAWRAHDLARDLLVLVEELRDAIEDDPEAEDPQWRQREVLQRLLVVLHTMLRQLEHGAIDGPEYAARFVAQTLATVEVNEVAALLDTSPKMVNKYRDGEVGQIRKNPHRITLVGQLVYELRYSMTPRGVLLWFDAPMEALDGRTPRQLLDEDPVANASTLITLSRGGRAQLDRGGVAYGDVGQAA
jgi:hypothetical protein